MYQKTTIIGHLGQDPESKELNSGVTVTTFSVATSETYKNKSGEKITATEWHRIECWRGMAEPIAKYCKKGDLIFLEGKIKTDSYEKGGEKRYSTKIVAESFKFMPKGGSSKSEHTEAQEKEERNNDLPF